MINLVSFVWIRGSILFLRDKIKTSATRGCRPIRASPNNQMRL